MKALNLLKKYMIVMVLIVIIILFGSLNSNFLTISNFTTILRQVSMTAIIGVGMAYVLISGNIDLSVGSMMSFTTVFIAKMVVESNMNVVLAIILGLMLCTVIGMINGVVVTKFRVAALISTLAMQQILRGVAYLMCSGLPIYGLPNGLKAMGQGYFFGWLPIPVVIMVVVLVLGAILLDRTYIGRYFYAIGSNKEAAKLSGLNTDNIQILTFAINGFLACLAGLIMLGRVASGQPGCGDGYEMDIITATVLGGVSISGGKGNILGAFIGVIIIGAMTNGLVILGLSEYWQQVIKGAILLFAVSFDGIQGAMREKKVQLSTDTKKDEPKAAIG